MKNRLWLWIPMVALCLVAGAKKEPAVTVRFYTETTSQSASQFAVPVQLQNPPHKSFISSVPNISEHDIQGIFPYQTSDGTLGCVFLLNSDGRLALDTLSVEKRGTSLVALVNGRQVIDLLIDRHITDGIVTIPRGLTLQEGLLLKKTFKTFVPVAPKK